MSKTLDDKRKFLINNVFIFTNRIFSKVITLLIFLFIARKYSVAEFGELIFIITLTNIFSFILDFGSSNLVVREIAVDNKRQSSLLTNILAIKIVFINIIVIGFFIALKTLSINLDFKVMVIFSIGIFFESALMSVVKSFEGLERMNISSLLVMLERILIASTMIVLSHENLLMRYSISYLISNSITFIIAIAIVTLNKNFENSKINLNEVKYVLTNSFVFFLFGISSIIYNRTDTFFLQQLNGSEQLGFYRANLQLIESIYFIPMSLGVSILPMFSRFYYYSFDKFKSFFKMIFLGLFFLGACITIFVLFNSEVIIKILYGDKFIISSNILKYLSLTIIIFFINSLIGNTLIAIKKEKQQFISMLFGTIIKLVLLYVLTLYYGVLGTCVSVIVGEVVILIFQSIGLKNLNIMKIHEFKVYLFTILILFTFHFFVKPNLIFSFSIISLSLIFFLRKLIHDYKLLI